jgi:hypothetical protein
MVFIAVAKAMILYLNKKCGIKYSIKFNKVLLML